MDDFVQPLELSHQEAEILRFLRRSQISEHQISVLARRLGLKTDQCAASCVLLEIAGQVTVETVTTALNRYGRITKQRVVAVRLRLV